MIEMFTGCLKHLRVKVYESERMEDYIPNEWDLKAILSV
jgi:hypothetical protein